jgi:hypothetical protein
MRTILLFRLFLVSLFLSTCAPKPANIDEIEQLSFSIIAKDLWSTQSRKSNIQSTAYQLFFNNKDWSIFWQKWFIKTIPSIDFKKYFTIYVLQGLKKTGGYEIDIIQVSFEKKKNVLSILLSITEPEPGQGVDLGETSPYVIAKVQFPTTWSNSIDSSKLKINFLKKIDTTKIPIEIKQL